MSQAESPVFAIEKLYVKDLSVEVPNAPAIYLESEAPRVEIQLQSNGQPLGEGAYEVVLTVTVTARIERKGKLLFISDSIHRAFNDGQPRQVDIGLVPVGAARAR